MNIYDVYYFFLRRFRPKRMRFFWNKFHLTSESKVLDVGGTLFNWNLLGKRPRLTMVNLTALTSEKNAEYVNWIIADGRYLPFKDGAFDVVYSNSLIEHLENLDGQLKFAAECMRVGKNYFIQTPNKWFPIEPHFLAPFIHWLPRQVSRRLLRNFTVWGWITRPTQQQCDAMLQEIRLLDAREMRSIFPQAELIQERLLGWTKSFIILKRD